MHDMVPNELLYTFAQVGSAFAGFSTLVAVVGNRGFATATVVSMLILSLIVVLFSLLPNVPLFDLESEGGWRAVSGLYCFAWASYWVYVMYGFRVRRYGIGFAEMSLANRVNAYITHPLSILALLAAFSGKFGDTVHVAYTVCLLVMLGLSGFLFVQLTNTLIKGNNAGGENR